MDGVWSITPFLGDLLSRCETGDYRPEDQKGQSNHEDHWSQDIEMFQKEINKVS